MHSIGQYIDTVALYIIHLLRSLNNAGMFPLAKVLHYTCLKYEELSITIWYSIDRQVISVVCPSRI